uniref:Uncharacterized protein n=1 Tax=viral metagenome TaxID=1070528 RepID=A0A6C0H521_9ZZZZ
MNMDQDIKKYNNKRIIFNIFTCKSKIKPESFMFGDIIIYYEKQYFTDVSFKLDNMLTTGLNLIISVIATLLLNMVIIIKYVLIYGIIPVIIPIIVTGYIINLITVKIMHKIIHSI